MDMKPIVLLSGPMGAGKTTVARALVAISSGQVAYIEGDTFWSFIVKGQAHQGRMQDFRTLMLAMTAAAVPYARNGYEVILDFSIPPSFLGAAQKVAKVRDVPLDFVVVRPSEAVCAQRAATRHAGAIGDYAPFAELYRSFDGFDKHTIADDAADAAAIAARIRRGLDAGTFRLTAG